MKLNTTTVIHPPFQGFSSIRRRCVFVGLFVGSILLGGCGFQLRVADELAPELTRVHVLSTDRPLGTQLSDMLRARGARVVAFPDNATTIDIRSSNLERTVLTLDASGRASTYALRYEIVFQVTAASGDLIQPAQTITLWRAYDYSPKLQLQADYEADFLTAEMRKEITLQIMQRLSKL